MQINFHKIKEKYLLHSNSLLKLEKRLLIKRKFQVEKFV